MEGKPCSNSLAVKTAHVLPPDTNQFGTLFGGILMAYIDDVAGISAQRHARIPVVTASTDSIDFLHPVKEGDSICVESFVTWTHETSMEVFVKAVAENLSTGEREVCTTAFLTFVAVDSDGSPTSIPPVYPETEEEETLHKGAPQRALNRRKRRKQSKELSKSFGTSYPWQPK